MSFYRVRSSLVLQLQFWQHNLRFSDRRDMFITSWASLMNYVNASKNLWLSNCIPFLYTLHILCTYLSSLFCICRMSASVMRRWDFVNCWRLLTNPLFSEFVTVGEMKVIHLLFYPLSVNMVRISCITCDSTYRQPGVGVLICSGRDFFAIV